jgi:HSP20 family protein
VNKPAVQRQSRPLLPELSELFSGLPAFAGLRPFFENHVLRLEDETKDGVYEVRAELPGVDPIEDVEVTVRDGRLTIDISATYDRGILMVSVPLSDAEAAEKHVEVYEIAPLEEDDDSDDDPQHEDDDSVDQSQGEDQPELDQRA